MKDEEIFSIDEAKTKWAVHGLAPQSAPVRARRKGLTKGVDGRKLRATGRNQQFNFRCRKGLKKEVDRAAKKAGLTTAEWMEIALEYALKGRNGEGTT